MGLSSNPFPPYGGQGKDFQYDAAGYYNPYSYSQNSNYNPIQRGAFGYNQYASQGYNPYQSQGYDPYGYQSQGYDPYGYQAKAYDSQAVSKASQIIDPGYGGSITVTAPPGDNYGWFTDPYLNMGYPSGYSNVGPGQGYWSGDNYWDPATQSWYTSREWSNLQNPGENTGTQGTGTGTGTGTGGGTQNTGNKPYKSGDKWVMSVTDNADPSKTYTIDLTATPRLDSTGQPTQPDGYDDEGNPLWRVDVYLGEGKGSGNREGEGIIRNPNPNVTTKPEEGGGNKPGETTPPLGNTSETVTKPSGNTSGTVTQPIGNTSGIITRPIDSVTNIPGNLGYISGNDLIQPEPPPGGSGGIVIKDPVTGQDITYPDIYDIGPFRTTYQTYDPGNYPMPQESVDPYLSNISTGVNPNFYTQYAEAGAAPLPGAPNLFQYGQAMGPDMGLPQQRNLQTAFNEQGIAQMPVSAGMTGQQAIMSRLQPQLDQQRESLRTQLINQGLRPGDEAYNIAMQQQSQRENDLLSQAALQGLNLDIAANQQGFQQAQARAEFANQALGQQYGMGVTGYQTGLQGLGAYNQAIAANQQSALAQAQMAAQLQEQGFSQAQAMQAAANAAQQQNFANMQTYQQAQNAAAAQAFQQQLAAAQYANAAQQQAYQQAAMIRQMPINEITALMSGSQIANPAFQAYQGAVAQPGDIQAATAQQAAWDQNIYNQKVASRNALMQGLFSLGGAGLGAWGAAAKGCWIAEAIYGVDDPRTHLVRAWLNGPFKATKIGSIVMKLYLKYGERIAEKVKKSKTLKAVLKPLFDMALGCALRDAAKRMLQIA